MTITIHFFFFFLDFAEPKQLFFTASWYPSAEKRRHSEVLRRTFESHEKQTPHSKFVCPTFCAMCNLKLHPDPDDLNMEESAKVVT